MTRIISAALLALAACASVTVDPNGVTRARTLGGVRVETHACAALGGAEPAAPDRICVSITGVGISEGAGGIVSGLVGYLFGRS